MATVKSTWQWNADITSITAIKHKTGEECEISTQVDEKGFPYVHIATNDETTKTTITAENIPVGKIMFLKYRLCNGYYPSGHFGVSVTYKYNGETKLAVGTPSGGVLNTELVKRHRGWVVGRVNAQGEMGRIGLWINDDTLVQAESIEIEIAHKDDLDVAYFMTDNLDVNLMPTVKTLGDDYYMHQATKFGGYMTDQWRKINDTMDGGTKQYDPFTPPNLPEHPEEPDPVFYTVSFDLNGYGASIDTKTILGGRKVSRPDEPTTTERYRFDGWYTNEECTYEYDFDSPVTYNLVLYAKWSKLSIVEKLIRIAENEQKVYDAGCEKGKASVGDYLPCSSKVKIDNYNLFGRKEVVLNIPLVTDLDGAFQQNSAYMNTTVEHLTVNGSLDGKIACASMAFYCGYNETTLKRLTLNCDFSKCIRMAYMMTYLAALEVIDGIPMDFSSMTGEISFHHCALGSALRELRVAPNTIKTNINFQNDGELSGETIQSIIDGLVDLTGQTSKKVTFHSKVLSRLTDEQINTIGAKNWTF